MPTADQQADALLEEMDDDLGPSCVGTSAVLTPEVSIGAPSGDLEPLAWEDVMPPLGSEWDIERRRQKALLRQMPRWLRRMIQRIRTTHHRQILIDEVVYEAVRRAGKLDRLTETRLPEDSVTLGRAYIPAVDLRSILVSLGRDDSFMRHIYAASKRIRRQGSPSPLSASRAWARRFRFPSRPLDPAARAHLRSAPHATRRRVRR